MATRVTMFPLTTQELHQFHRTDREFFCFLIFKLRRDVTQSLLVMALWLWLENIGFPNLIHTFMAITNPSLINAIVDEAIACLACLEADNPVIPRGGGLTLTKSIIHIDISMRLFHKKKHTAIAGIRSILKNICSRIFNDILQIVLKRNTNNASTSRASKSKARTSPKRPNFVLPGFPHPLFGEFDMTPQVPKLDLLNNKIWKEKRPSDDVTEEDRAMFLTFSKGFPVSETEVRLLFSTRYGDCVESVSMGEPDEKTQKLFAVMVVKDVATVDRILKGQKIAKLHFNGKHVWARKFVFRWDCIGS